MIKFAKLISGEFVIGNLMELNLTNVMLIRFSTDARSGIIDTTLLPYMAPLNNSVAKIISADKIMAFDEPSKELQIKYLQHIQSMIKTFRGEEDGKSDSNETENTGSDGISGEDKGKTEKPKPTLNIS